MGGCLYKKFQDEQQIEFKPNEKSDENTNHNNENNLCNNQESLMSEFICPKCGNNKFSQRFIKENALKDVQLGNNKVIRRYRYNDGKIEYNDYEDKDKYWTGCIKIRMEGKYYNDPFDAYYACSKCFYVSLFSDFIQINEEQIYRGNVEAVGVVKQPYFEY